MANLQGFVGISFLVVVALAIVRYGYLSSRESQYGKYFKWTKWHKDIIR